jgi:hypothetical protein
MDTKASKQAYNIDEEKILGPVLWAKVKVTNLATQT